MDILIKGLTLPKDDALSVIIYPDGVVEVQVGWNGDVPVYSNAFKATAIELPLHGNLVEGDAVLQALIEELGDGSRYARIRDKLIDKVPVIVEE